MAFQLFGFRIGRDKPIPVRSFAPPEQDDGAITIDSYGGIFGSYLDLDASTRNEVELITRYREMSLQPEIDNAINEIVNEAIVTEDMKAPVQLVLDKLNYSADVKNRIREEFDNILNLLDFNNEGQDLFRNWYIDGRIFLHVIIDEEHPEDGIKELRRIDPRRIRKVRQLRRDMSPANVEVISVEDEYYIFTENGIDGASANVGVRIALDSVVYAHSGVLDNRTGTILSFMHKAIKPLNQLRMIEDATVIYRLSRAPERRIFYIDVGNLPKLKAEQYMKEIMSRYRNKLVYDSVTGEIRDDKKFLSMMEDFWLPRREGGRGTEIQTLPGGANLGEMEDVHFFQDKLFNSLNVPVSRLKADNPFGGLGRAAEITRDELRFSKFIFRLRNRFTQILDDLLRVQLILKGICTREDWSYIRQRVFYDFLKDSYFAELKALEIFKERIAMVREAEDYVGKYISQAYVRRKLLRQTDEDIAQINAEMAAEGSGQAEEGGEGEEGIESVGGGGEGGESPQGGGSELEGELSDFMQKPEGEEGVPPEEEGVEPKENEGEEEEEFEEPTPEEEEQAGEEGEEEENVEFDEPTPEDEFNVDQQTLDSGQEEPGAPPYGGRSPL